MDSETPIVAMIYDFDWTLLNGNMQEFGLIGSLGYENDEFWAKVTDYAIREKMDANLACMLYTKRAIEKAGNRFTRDFLKSFGKTLDDHFMPGVEDWFSSINKIGKSMGLRIEHYLITSGFREIVEGSEIIDNFREIFACEYQYGFDGLAMWPKNVINFTTKTQYISRISKGTLDLADSNTVNTSIANRRIPYANMVYFGDGYTDIPCMTMMRNKGGHPIAVYKEKIEVAENLLRDKRVEYIAPADYTEGSELYRLISSILSLIKDESALRRVSDKQSAAIER